MIYHCTRKLFFLPLLWDRVHACRYVDEFQCYQEKLASLHYIPTPSPYQGNLVHIWPKRANLKEMYWYQGFPFVTLDGRAYAANLAGLGDTLILGCSKSRVPLPQLPDPLLSGAWLIYLASTYVLFRHINTKLYGLDRIPYRSIRPVHPIPRW